MSVFKHTLSVGKCIFFFFLEPDLIVNSIKSCHPALPTVLYLTDWRVETCFVCITADFPKDQTAPVKKKWAPLLK